MPTGVCELCWAMAQDDVPGQIWRVEFHYRKVRGIHHGMRWHETGEMGPHMIDPYRL